MVRISRSDGNIYTNSGKLLKYSGDGLAEVIASQNRCLLCGEVTQANSWAREHVLPNWVIRHCNLREDAVLLPSGQAQNYTRDQIRCCAKCNEDYKTLFEDPISAAVRLGHQGVLNLFQSNGGDDLIFAWLAFIAAKRRLNSAHYRFNPDRRVSSPLLEDREGLERISWMLALGRSLVLGSHSPVARFLAVARMMDAFPRFHAFDLVVDPRADTIGMIVGETAFFASFFYSVPLTVTQNRLSFLPREGVRHLQFFEVLAEISVQSLTYESKFYSISEHDGRLIFSKQTGDGSIARERIPRNLVGELTLLFGKRRLSSIVSTSYWEYIVEQLMSGYGSFFPDRTGYTFLDPRCFGIGPMSEQIFNSRLERLLDLARSSDPLLREEIDERWR